MSVRPGGTITFHVNTNPVARYRIEISRLGWYGGAGGRRITCLVGSTLDPGCGADEPGMAQPIAPAPDPQTGETSAGWSTTNTLTVPPDWTSGYYLAVFRLTSGPTAGQTGFVPFIVQAPLGDHATILVQVPTNTWQAYNAWGGRDFYTRPPAVEVSFDRPFAHRLLFDWEYPLIRFLERGGWDVSYATDDDVDADPAILLDHRLDMDAGHDEYWTKTMRDAWEAARAAGVNLAFMGANAGFWQVRYTNGRRAMIGYKYKPDPYSDPSQRTTQFRELDPPRPECQLFGVQFQNDVLYHRNLDLVAAPGAAGDPWFAGTGLTPGSVLLGLGGTETDSTVPGCHVPPVTTLFSSSGPPLRDGTPVRQDTVRYTACSGAEVFSTGSLQFPWGLDSWRDSMYVGADQPPLPPTNPGLQLFMTNALADLTQSHVPAYGPPHICVPTANFTVPVTWAALGQPVRLTSTAADQYGQLASQRWTILLNQRTTTKSGPTITQRFLTPGTANITLAAADTSGAAGTRSTWLAVCPCPWSSSWPQAAQQGGACQLMSIGAVRRLGHRFWFTPNQSITRYSLSTYRIVQHAGRIRQIRLTSYTGASTALPLPLTRAPLALDVSAWVASRRWQQKFMVTAASGQPIPAAGRLTETLCDSTAGRILTPAFRGRHSTPLRIAISSRRQLTITLAGPNRATLHQRVTATGRHTAIISLAAKSLPRGVYRITISAVRSKLPAIQLTALAL
ncbi:MAG: hypothetical protein JO168_26410 [Solirubrobacterales bacterium]|nr:hypothetical protein [Solirubrobacterales bacterium]